MLLVGVSAPGTLIYSVVNLRFSYQLVGRKTLKKVRILALNNLHPLKCESCDSKAIEICTECMEVFCEQCLIEHGCSEEMALPVVNSPRMGVCGYCGESEFDNFTVK